MRSLASISSPLLTHCTFNPPTDPSSEGIPRLALVELVRVSELLARYLQCRRCADQHQESCLALCPREAKLNSMCVTFGNSCHQDCKLHLQNNVARAIRPEKHTVYMKYGKAPPHSAIRISVRASNLKPLANGMCSLYVPHCSMYLRY